MNNFSDCSLPEPDLPVVDDDGVSTVKPNRVLRGSTPEVDFLDEPELHSTLDRLRELTTASDGFHSKAETFCRSATNLDFAHLETSLVLPCQLGSYRLISKLGQGGMGVVYKAVHTQLEKAVAIKVLSIGRLHDDRSAERFKREIRANGRVQHPNIVVAHDGGEIDSVHFLVMEYIDGLDISALSKTRGELPISVACEIVRQAAMGLQHAHENGLIHRDIKPSNLMLDRTGTVKVLDLGLARIASDQPTSLVSDSLPTVPTLQCDELTAAGVVVGTSGYLSPEQISGGPVDHRADLYSLGVTLYKLLAGRLPFPSDRFDTNEERSAAPATTQPLLLSTIRKGLPAALTQLVDKMLSTNPSGRLGTAAEFADALQPFAGAQLAGLATAPTEAIPAALEGAYGAQDRLRVAKDWRWFAHRKTGQVAIVTSLLFAVSFIVLQSFSTGDSRPASVDPYSRDRAAAQWIGSIGGVFSGPSSADQFDLEVASLTGRSFRSNDLKVLAGLPALRVANFSNSLLDAEGLTHVLQNRNIQRVELNGTDLDSTDFQRLGELPHLGRLRVDATQITDSWDFLAELPSLRLLWIHGDHVPDAKLLGKFKHLRGIGLYTTHPISGQEVEELQQQNPTLVIGFTKNGESKYLGNYPVRNAAHQLANQGWEFSGIAALQGVAWSSEQSHAWDEAIFCWPRDVRAPRGRKLTPSDFEFLEMLRDQFSDIDLSECSNLRRLPEFLRGKIVQQLLLNDSSLSNETFLEIGNRCLIGTIDVTGTQVTIDGVHEFRRLQPTCELVSSFGEFPAEHRFPSRKLLSAGQ